MASTSCYKSNARHMPYALPINEFSRVSPRTGTGLIITEFQDVNNYVKVLKPISAQQTFEGMYRNDKVSSS